MAFTYNRAKHNPRMAEKENTGKASQSQSFLNNGNSNDRQTPKKQPSYKANAQTLNEFIKECQDNAKDVRNIKAILADNIMNVANAAFAIEKSDDKSDITALNKTLAVFGLGAIPKTVKMLISSNIIDIPDEDSESKISYLISRILIALNDIGVDEDTIECYISIFECINKSNITMLTSDTGINGDLALDMVLSFPIAPSQMDPIFIAKNYNKFLMRIMDHVEENQSVLNSHTIQKIFEFMFGSNCTKGKVANSIIGKYLGNKPTIFDKDPEETIYREFVKFLYETLNSYDDNSIRKTLNFVKKQRTNGSVTLFNEDDAKAFENIDAIWNK